MHGSFRSKNNKHIPLHLLGVVVGGQQRAPPDFKLKGIF
jgi:hypothetical protein